MLALTLDQAKNIAIAVAVVAMGAWLGLPAGDWALLALAMGLVLAAEAANTAIETLADRITTEHDPAIARAKDAAAGAVLLAAIAAAAVVWLRLKKWF